MELKEIFKMIKDSFCQLLDHKIRQGNTLEVITAFSTLNSKFVSVFIRPEQDKIVVTDGGWVSSNYYDHPAFDESEEITSRIIEGFQASYDVKSTTDPSALTYYYKTCVEPSQIAGCVFDIANFVVGAVNAHCISFRDEKEQKERETFRRDANTFLAEQYGKLVTFRRALDDFQSIKFNAIISWKSQLYLISYVTGSTPYYFENDLRKSIVNFEITEKSKYKQLIREKISIINNQSQGYNSDRSTSIRDLLREKTTREPLNWTEKEKIRQYVRPMAG